MNQESPAWAMYLAYDQWKEEHDALQDRLLDLCGRLQQAIERENPVAEARERGVMERFERFMSDWERHVKRERESVYPFAKSMTCGGRMGPVSALEEDGRIAGAFYREFRHAAENGASPEEIWSRLLQVLLIVAEHFRVEDEVVVPLTEKWMDEVAYSGS